MASYTQQMLKEFRQELKVLEGEKTELESRLALVNSKIAVLQSKIETYERGNKIMLDYEEREEREKHLASASKEGETPTGKMGIVFPTPPPATENSGMFGLFGKSKPSEPTAEKKGWLWGGKRTHKRRSKRLYRK
jgi:hypothetical protein